MATRDVILAFLDTQVRDDDAAAICRAIKHPPSFKHHMPVRLEEWLGEMDQER